jgi:hypothetical protein
MGVASTNTIAYKLVASGSILDLFDDEDILLSDNITGLFDVGTLPVDFSRTITLPATKKNNAFFEHAYDISIDAPYLFSTNVKVPAYLDFDGIYLASGYLQLNKVVMNGDLGILSYDVSLFGAVSSWGKEINNNYLTDLTSLASLNHTSSITNISASWHNNLFNGDIVYPLADYGTGYVYSAEEDFFGIDANEGALHIQNFKPAIRVKKVWDACFEQFGYTYSGSFWGQEWVNSVYMVCNNSLKYPEYNGVELEDYGVVKFGAISGSGQTDLEIVSSSTDATRLAWYNIQKDPQGFMGANSSYKVETPSTLRGVLNLELQVSGALNVPSLYLHYWPTQSTPSASPSYTSLVNFSRYFTGVELASIASGDVARNEKFTLQTEFNTSFLNTGSYYFGLSFVNGYTPGKIVVTMDPGGQPKSYLEIKEVCNAADNRIMDIPSNMPYGTTGIKLIDFIKGIQKKFNLVIYPNKTKPKEFIVETFNDWYKKGVRKDFNKYINLNSPVEVTPANNLAVNKLTFGDAVDQDYISQQFSKAANRAYGTSYYTDTTNFFSQGELNVTSTFGVSPLVYLAGTGLSGSVGGITPPPVTQFFVGECRYGYTFDATQTCTSPAVIFTYTLSGTLGPGLQLFRDQYGQQPITGLNFVVGPSGGNIYEVSSTNGYIIGESGYYC